MLMTWYDGWRETGSPADVIYSLSATSHSTPVLGHFFFLIRDHCCLQRRPTIPAYSSKWSRTRHFAISQRNELKLSLNAHLTSLPILASFGFGSMNTIGPPGGQGGPDWPPMHIFTTFQLNELKLSVNTHIASLPILASIWFGYINTNMAPRGPRLAPHA